MLRTQISLTQEEYGLAKQEAAKGGMSLAEFFRRALRRCLPLSRQKGWMRFCGLVASGNPRSSRQLDDLVYGQKE